MFQDEAGFGRINKPKYCWCKKGKRPSVPCHHIREYRYVYGAVEPLTGESCFVVMPYCNTDCMNLFLEELSNTFPRDNTNNHLTYRQNTTAIIRPPCVKLPCHTTVCLRSFSLTGRILSAAFIHRTNGY